MVAAMRGISVASNPRPIMVTLPKPNDGFHWTQLPGGPALVCDALQPLADHFFTTREWRLGERRLDPADGWLEVAAAARVGVEHFGRLQQVHGADAVTYKKGVAGPGGVVPVADIALTDDPSVAVAVQTADCLPILLADRRTGAVAAAHAGWRGLAARVPSVVVSRMQADFGSRPGDLVVAIGPAIGACCYEVGEDVRAQFARAGFGAAALGGWFRVHPLMLAGNPPVATLASTRRPSHWFFDGWSCACDQLQEAGVAREQILIADL